MVKGPNTNIRVRRFSGSGAFGEVYEGRVHGLNLIEEGSVGETPSKKPQKIAVKTLRKGATDEDKAGFLKEAQLMSKFTHPHILQGLYSEML